MAETGMTEVEPGRWMSDWQGGDPKRQEWVDSQGPDGPEYLDLLTRAGRIQNQVHALSSSHVHVERHTWPRGVDLGLSSRRIGVNSGYDHISIVRHPIFGPCDNEAFRHSFQSTDDAVLHRRRICHVAPSLNEI